MTDERPPPSKVDLSGLERLSASAPPPRERKPVAGRLLAGLAFFGAAVVIAAIPWFFLARKPAPPPAQVPPSVAPRTSPSASPSPSPVAVAGTYEVTGLKSGCLRVHAAPGIGTPILDCLLSGIRVTSDGQTREADGYRWLHVHDPVKKVDGWAADEYLKRPS